MKVSISTIKDWFRNGLRPTQSHFWATWDSFWHKDEQIPVTSIENLQENLDEKVDVETYEIEKVNFQNTSFKNVGTGTPNTDTIEPAYREGKIGIGEPNPIETVDVIGSGKFQYTYSDGSIARATLGGENTSSEIGLPSGFIKTNTLAFFPDPSVHPGTQGYFYTGDISSIAPAAGKLSTGIGIASLTDSKYARTTYFASDSNGNPESEFVGILTSRHEDGNAASVEVSNKGGDIGENEESYLSLTSSNDSTFSRISLTPRIATIKGALLQLKEYADDTLIEGYVHNDDITSTGTAATVVGALKPLGVDSQGNVGKILTPTGSSTGLEAIDEGNGIGWRFVGRNSDNFGDVGQDAVDLSSSTTSSITKGATGRWSFSTGQNNTADGLWSFAGGVNSFASGAESIAYGADINITGAGSTGFGRLNTGNGQYIFVAGLSNTVTHNNGNSLGSNNTVSGQWGTAIGRSLFSRSGYEYSIGSFGTDYVANNSNTDDPEDRLFNVSNGLGDTQRSDAFTIYKNGAVQLHPIAQVSITNATVGMMIVDSADSNKLKFYDGTAWKIIVTN